MGSIGRVQRRLKRGVVGGDALRHGENVAKQHAKFNLQNI
jgi:hypothetical protein